MKEPQPKQGQEDMMVGRLTGGGGTPDVDYNSVTSQYVSGARGVGGPGVAKGVTHLMQQCTQMLRSRMADGHAAPPAPGYRLIPLLQTQRGNILVYGGKVAGYRYRVAS